MIKKATIRPISVLNISGPIQEKLIQIQKDVYLHSQSGNALKYSKSFQDEYTHRSAHWYVDKTLSWFDNTFVL